jgi:hypothetical protein
MHPATSSQTDRGFMISVENRVTFAVVLFIAIINFLKLNPNQHLKDPRIGDRTDRAESGPIYQLTG